MWRRRGDDRWRSLVKTKVTMVTVINKITRARSMVAHFQEHVKYLNQMNVYTLNLSKVICEVLSDKNVSWFSFWLTIFYSGLSLGCLTSWTGQTSVWLVESWSHGVKLACDWLRAGHVTSNWRVIGWELGVYRYADTVEIVVFYSIKAIRLNSASC